MNRELKHFLTYGLGNILQSSLGILLLPLYLRYFTPDDYGVISVLIVLSSLFMLCFSGGVINGLIRLYFEKDQTNQKEILGTTILWYLFFGTIGGVVLFTLSPQISYLIFQNAQHAKLIRLLGVTFPFFALNVVPFYILRLGKKAGLYVLFSLFNFLTDFGFKVYLIVFLKRGLVGYFESSIITYALSLTIIMPHVINQVKFNSNNFVFLKQLLQLGVPFIFTGLSAWILASSDRFLIANYLGESAVGVFSLAYNLSNIFVLLLFTPISLLLDPFFFSYAAQKSLDKTKLLLQKILLCFTFYGGILYLIIGLGAKDLLRILIAYGGTQPLYINAGTLVPIMTMGTLFYFLTLPATLSALFIKKPKITAYVCLIVAFSKLTINFFLIPILGLFGVTFIFLFSYLLLFLLYYIMINKVFPVPYPWKQVLVGFGYLSIALLVSWPLTINNPILSFLTKITLGVTIFVFLTYKSNGFLNQDDKRKIFSYFIDFIQLLEKSTKYFMKERRS